MQPLACNPVLEAEEQLGQWHPLVEQLGSSECLVPLGSASAALRLPRITHRSSLQSFLESYKSQILIPLELPAILRAYRHASRNETRELIAFDQQIAHEPAPEPFATASRRVGQFQLRRLRPLRDHRLLQRYLAAVDAERAQGWHTLVYGLTLSIYSLSPRLGIVLYERQTLQGFLFSAARSLHLTWLECRQILNELCADLPHELNDLNKPREWVVTSTR